MPLLVVSIIAIALGCLIMGATARRPWVMAVHAVCGIVSTSVLIVLLLAALIRQGS